MKYIGAVLVIFLSVSCLYAKKIDLQQENQLLKQQIEQVQEELRTQQASQQNTARQIEAIQEEIESLRGILKQQKTDFHQTTQRQQQKMEKLVQAVVDTSEEMYQALQRNDKDTAENIVRQKDKIESLQNTGRKYVYLVWILVLGLAGIVIVSVLKNKKLNRMIRQLKSQIQKNKEDINLFFQEQINLCHHLLENNAKTADSDQPADFSLALKVADEITLMERNMAYMDATVKGFRQLKRSIETLKDKLNSQGYEMPELLGRKFNSGMKLTVISSFPTDTLAHGEEVISKIIKPQVNYKGKMIQSAQVEVSIGE